MFYLLKVLETLLSPLGLFIIVCFLIGVYIYRKSPRIGAVLTLMAIFFYIVATPWVGDALVTSLEHRYSQPRTVTGDVIVMLGGGAIRGTPDMNGLGNPTGDAANRLLCTARLYHLLKCPILLSGGPMYHDNGVSSSEALIEKRELIALGIPATQIWTESNSRNTQENAQFATVILRAHHWTKPILVTSAYHMARAVMDFRKVGTSVLPYPTDYQVNAYTGLYDFVWLPSMDGLALTNLALHEYSGMLATAMGVRG